MNLPQTGGCQCGTLRYEITAAPLLTYTCHRTDCQQLTSSAFSMAIVVPDSAFRLTQGKARLVQRTADSGRIVTRWICPECGSWICGGPQPGAAQAELVRRVRCGTLDDTSWLRPTTHFWTRSKQPWVVLAEGSQIFEMQPPDLLGTFNSTR
jgi:hypothetical protein